MGYVADSGRRAVTVWLYVVAVMILGMLALGGLTRLTGSGLSMVDWRPLMGTVPPIGQDAWMEVFRDYQQYPEYKIHNSDMTLDGFKFIFMMEYSHRVLGRLIGMVFFFPFAFFWVKGYLSPAMIRRCLLLFFLGGLQGLIGWYMVKSGLVDVPRVSQYRLTLHLTTAILTMTLAVWYALDLREGPPHEQASILRPLSGFALLLLVLAGIQIVSGGFVAGLKAGHAFNTFPTMNGQWIPAGMFSLSPWFSNFLDNPTTVQFFHRWSAMIVTAAVLFFFFKHFKPVMNTRMKLPMLALPALLVIQVLLGIFTLLHAVPIALGSLHQVVGVLLWMNLVVIRWETANA